MDSIIIGDLEIEVIKKDIKNLHLSVHPPDGRIRMAVPLHMDEETIRLFAISKIKWIKKQQEKFKNQERQPKRLYVSGESHYFKGNRYLLNIFETKGKQRVEINGIKYIDLYLRKNNTYKSRETLMNNYYRNYLKENIPLYINKWQPILNVKVKDWGVKLMKTKWGTCNSSAKRIWINLELAKTNPRCLEYIIVHEMIHLIEVNHNERFIKIMDQHLPNWRGIRDELNSLIFESGKWGY